MKYIVMLKNETMATDKGPMTLPKDGKPKLVEDWIADSIVGRGYAYETDENGTPVAPPPPQAEVQPEEPVDLTKLNIAELRDLAKSQGIENWKTARKKDLLE